MNKVVEAFVVILGGLCLAALIACLISLPVKWLWNALMPDLFGLKVITFWQAMGLAFLCSLLFKSSSSSKSSD